MLCVCVYMPVCAGAHVHVHLRARRQLQAPSSCAVYFCFLWDRVSLTCDLPSRQASVPWDLSSFPPYGIMPTLFVCVCQMRVLERKRDHYFVRYLLFAIKLLESFFLNVTPIYFPLIVWSILDAFSSTPGKTWINDVLLTCMAVEAKHSLILWTLIVAKRKAGAVTTVYRWGILASERQR